VVEKSHLAMGGFGLADYAANGFVVSGLSIRLMRVMLKLAAPRR
jgi:hypothetical protein